MSKRTYYLGPDAVVTDELFVWQAAAPARFVVRDLRKVGLVRAGSDVQKFVPALFVGALVLAGTSLALLDPPTSYAVSLLAVVGPGLLSTVWLTRKRRWELHASYRGAQVVIYSSTDARVFNQVSRALRRAMENARPPSGIDLAAA